jgi:hypothetical protein
MVLQIHLLQEHLDMVLQMLLLQEHLDNRVPLHHTLRPHHQGDNNCIISLDNSMDIHHHRDINNLPPHMGNQVLEATSREGMVGDHLHSKEDLVLLVVVPHNHHQV